MTSTLTIISPQGFILALAIEGVGDEEARGNAVLALQKSARGFDPKSSVSLIREDGSEIMRTTIEGLGVKHD